MPEIHHQYYPQLLSSITICVGFFFIFDLLGRIIFHHCQLDNDKLQNSNAISLFLGLTVGVCVFSLIYFKLITTQWLVFLGFILAFVYFRRKENQPKKFKYIFLNEYLYEIFIFIFLIFYRFYQLLDKEYPELNTENCDQYNYLDNLTLIQMFGSENSFLELESRFFGFNYKFMNYHFFEYNLGIILKKNFPFNNFEFFQLCLQPFILGVALISFTRVLSYRFKTSYIFTGILIITFFLIHRASYIHYSLLYPLKESLDLNLFKEFPFYAISDPYFLYPSSFLPKISVLLFGFSGYLYSVFNNNSFVRIISIGFIFTSNLSYFPLILIYEVIDFVFSNERSYWFLGFSGFLFLAILGYTFYSNFGSQTLGRELFFSIDIFFSPIEIYQVLNREILFILGNFYSVLFYFSFLFWLLLIKSNFRFLLFSIIFTFPFVFINYEIFGKLFIIVLILFIFVYRKNCFLKVFSDLFISKIVISFLIILLIVNLSKFILESFQVGYNSFVLLISFLPVYFILGQLRNNKSAPLVFGFCLIFIVHNVFSGTFYFNRIFFPGTSASFAKTFYSKFPEKKKIIGVYFTKFDEIPYFYVNKPCFNLQNYSDSLFTTCISFDLLTKKDTMEIKKRNSWDKFLSFPFSQYAAGEGEFFHGDQLIRKFMKKVNCDVIFIADNAKGLEPAFIHKISRDSLYCKQFGYTAYFIKEVWKKP